MIKSNMFAETLSERVDYPQYRSYRYSLNEKPLFFTASVLNALRVDLFEAPMAVFGFVLR
jgi:hypothetical protein